ncbi:MAG TPA: hypothetical protein VMS98_16085 [Thermoanaerobaculia bacterium]|nr:hypothetical protein [Thermoanaerobaculia bacterium]
MKRWIVMVLLAAASAQAQIVAEIDGGIAVAREGRLDVYDATASRVVASFEGVRHPSRIVAGDGVVALLDTWSNEARIIDIRTGQSKSIQTLESPIDGLFSGPTLFVLARDAATLQRFASDGSKSSLAVAADPAFMRERAGKLIVYSRREGSVQEVSLDPFTVTRRVAVAAGASDLEVDRNSGYLVYPDEGVVRTFSLSSFETTGEVRTGAVPVDISVVRESSALSPARLAVADPSSKRIWSVEGRQSQAAAFARGFVRGFIGLGFRPGPDPGFSTGVDRVVTAHGLTAAYDTSTGTVYRIDKSKPTAIAGGVAPGGFAIVSGGLAFWENGRLTVRRLQN